MFGRIELVVFVIYLLYNDIYSQPITNDALDFLRSSRQVDFETCCPCPGNANSYTEVTSPSARNLDDCPIQSRSTDSEGSSSGISPSAIHTSGLASRPSNQKDEAKNLLEPEVDLASSVLETIREATEVEYQDALARDAAKSRTTLNDNITNESAPRIVTFILPNHNEDNEDAMLLETTNIEESKCIHPLDNIRTKSAGAQNLPKLITRVNTLDVDTPRNDEPIEKYLDGENDAQSGKIQRVDAKSELVVNRNSCPKYVTETNSESDPLVLFADQTNIINNERAVDSQSNLQAPGSKLKAFSLIPDNNLFKVKNLLKLRNQELFTPIKKIDIPLLTLPSLFQRQLELPDLNDLLGNDNYLKKSNEWNNIKNCKKSSEEYEPGTKTDIIEKLPLIFNKNNDKNNTSTKFGLRQPSNIQIMPTSQKAITEIIDTVPSASDHVIIKLNGNTVGNNIDLTENEFKENEEACTNAGQSYEVIDSVNDALNENYFDLVLNDTDEDPTISITDYADDSNYPLPVDNEVKATDCFEIKSEDSEHFSNDKTVPNNDSNSFSKNNHEDSNTPSNRDKLDASSDNNTLKDMTTLLKQNTTLSITQRITTLKEDIQKKIQDLRKTHIKDNKSNKLKLLIQENIRDTDCHNNDSTIQSGVLQPNNSNENYNTLDNISIEDLQNMSDSLLKINDLNKKLVSNENQETNQLKTTNVTIEDNFPSQTNGKESFVSRLPSTKKEKYNKIDAEENERSSYKSSKSFNEQPEASVNPDQCANNCLEGECAGNIHVNNNQPDYLIRGVDPEEMAAEASNPVTSSIHRDSLNLFSKLQSPIFQDKIVQPASLIPADFNLFPEEAKLDLGSLLNIPKLDEIRERITDVFGVSERDSKTNEIDCKSNGATMFSEPSESIFQTIPLLKPLKDIDIDIFQLKPLKLGESNLLSEIPTLNLKSYQPISKNLQLRPVLFESFLGNGENLLGTTFQIRPESGLKNLLSSPFESPTTIEDVTSHLRENIESLVSNSPLNSLQDFQLGPNINTMTEDLRSQTQNTIKNIQENIGDPLKLLQKNNMVKPPEIFLERIVDVTNDLNDKLKGLHHDLNDRLSSIHENILDKTKLSSMSNSFFDDRTLKGSVLNSQQRRNLQNLERLSAEKGNKASTPLNSRPNSKKLPQSHFPKINGKDKLKFRSYKMPSSASVSVPKSVPAPYLKEKDTQSPLSLVRESNIKPLPHGIMRETSKSHRRVGDAPKIKLFETGQHENTAKNSINEKNIKVTIATTTPSPLSVLKSKKVNSDKAHPELRLGKSQSKNKQDYDIVKAPSNIKSVTPKLTHPRNVESTDEKVVLPKTNNVKTTGLSTIKPLTEWLKERKASKSLSSNIFDSKLDETKGSSDMLKSATASEPFKKGNLAWPDITENSFLSKVRDAVKARMSSLTSVKTLKETAIPDTQKAASEITDVAISDTLKENVPYKCKMVCTKET